MLLARRKVAAVRATRKCSRLSRKPDPSICVLVHDQEKKQDSNANIPLSSKVFLLHCIAHLMLLVLS